MKASTTRKETSASDPQISGFLKQNSEFACPDAIHGTSTLNPQNPSKKGLPDGLIRYIPVIRRERYIKTQTRKQETHHATTHGQHEAAEL